MCDRADKVDYNIEFMNKAMEEGDTENTSL
jgi:hypothetical protein